MATTLVAGDIAFVGVQGDGSPERFAFVLLRDVEAGTEIHFTDNGWLASGAFRPNEGVLRWTAPADVAAGTVVTWSGNTGPWSAVSGSFALANTGDQVVAFQGTVAAPTALLAAIQTDADAWQSDAADAGTSAVPGVGSAALADLVEGTFSVAIGASATTENDNGAYGGPTSGDADALRAATNDAANWTVTRNTSDPLAFPAGPFVVTGGDGGGGTDPLPGVEVTQPSLLIAEGGFGTTSARLTTRPSADVAISLVGDGQVTASVASLTFTPDDWDEYQIFEVRGVQDAAAEGTHPGTLSLAPAASADPAYDGLDAEDIAVLITDDDDTPVRAIGEVQGAGHRSTFAGNVVAVQGNVTAVDTNGFYVQDAGDGDVRTSDGIFVFTGWTRPTVSVGQGVRVEGTVSEFQPGGATTANLTTTQIVSPTVTVLDAPLAGVAATVIGAAGRSPPTEVIQDDAFTSFDVATDGVDFYESLEGMLVTVDAPRVVASTNGFGEAWVVADGGAGATGLNARGGITITEADLNPERIQIDFDAGILPGAEPVLTTGDRLADVTGVVTYNFGNYEVAPVSAVSVVAASTLARETTALARAADALLVATYNVENLDPGDTENLARLGRDIAANLNRPDIVALQEIQDNNGAVNDAVTDGTLSGRALADAVAAAGGPRYVYVEIAPADDTSGGQPGGNIRNAFLYDPSRVRLLGLEQVAPDSAAFTASRIPLVGDFAFGDELVTLVNVHSSSKGGGTPLFGDTFPPVNGSEDERLAQSREINAYVDERLAERPGLKMLVIGDHNEFDWERPQVVIRGEDGGGSPVLFDLVVEQFPERERYTYSFEGNAQALDRTLATAAARDVATYDPVHINAEFPAAEQASDHDPSVTLLRLAASAAVEFTLQDASRPLENLIYTDAASPSAQDSLSRTDSTLDRLARFSEANGDVDLRAAGFGRAAATGEGAPGGFASLDWAAEGVAGFAKAGAYDSALRLQVDAFSGGTLRLRNWADLDLLFADEGAAGPSRIEVFGARAGRIETGDGAQVIRVASDNDGTPTALYNPNGFVVSTGAGADRVELSANPDRDYAPGRYDPVLASSRVDLGAGNDYARGTRGDDTLLGGSGNDSLLGYVGDDAVEGGSGNDWMEGGAGDDTFVFRASDGAGRDRVADFDRAGDDAILLVGFAAADSYEAVVAAATQTSAGVVTLALGGGAFLRLEGGVTLASLTADDFLFA